MIGVAITMVASFFVAFVAAFIVLRRTMGIGLELVTIAKVMACGLAMVVIIFVIKNAVALDPILRVIISLVVGLSAYSVLILRTRAVRKTELEMLGKLAIPIPKVLFRLAKMVAG